MVAAHLAGLVSATMNATHYQTRSARTLPEAMRPLSQDETALLMGVLGLNTEAGELGDHVKKALFHGHELDKNYLMKEAGDVLWYLSSICTIAGLNLSEVMRENIAKLERRYPDGFSQEASVNRKE